MCSSDLLLLLQILLLFKDSLLFLLSAFLRSEAVILDFPFHSWASASNLLAFSFKVVRIFSSFCSINSCFAIMITILALNFLGDGLRDALDPKLKR